MSLNFFGWIREGVKQSVLMGVHDAIDHLGPRPDDDPIGQRLLGFLAPGADSPATRQLPLAGGGRKKLGRSLKDIQAESPSSAEK